MIRYCLFNRVDPRVFKGIYVIAQQTHKKPRLRERTDSAWFSRLLRHPAWKRSGSILTTPESARGMGHGRHSVTDLDADRVKLGV